MYIDHVFAETYVALKQPARAAPYFERSIRDAESIFPAASCAISINSDRN